MNDDLLQMSDDSTWPIYPFLPMKRPINDGSGRFPEFGVLVAGKRSTIYAQSIGEVIEKGFDDKQVQVAFGTFEELIENGWVVD